MNALSTARSFLRRAAHSILGASLCALGAAVLDAAWARAAAGDAARQGGLSVYLADAGLLAPVAIAVGIAAVVGGIVLDPERPPSPSRFIGAVRLRAVGRPADVAAFVPLAVLGGFFWMTFSAHLARALLALEVGPALAGVAIATGSLGLGLLSGLAVLALTPPLRRALANASEGHPACVDPAVTGAFALLAAGSLFAFGVATGGVSGEGGLFGIYGIFKRAELDLRAPAELLAIALGGLLAPAAIERVRPLGALLVGLAPALLTVRDASALDTAPALAQAIERGAPLGRPALAALRKLTDRDHDGYSGSFGGGDCDDRNAKVNPGATDVPDNGVDEDCSGADLSMASLAKLAPLPPAPRKPAAERPKIPADLNLILLTIDTLRADLHYAGNPHELSPNLDKLAARSVVFDRAYALASYTGKSVGPMLAGKYGSETHRNWAHSNAFTKEDTFLAERLKQAGFHTMSVQAMNYFGAQSGLHRGFDVVNMSAAAAGGLIKDMENSSSSDRVTDAALKLLASPDHAGKRFFLWAHYLDPHADYLHHDDVPKFGTSARDMYDGEVAFVDKHVGRLLDAIAAAPWGERTIIVVTSDHGEAFGEHKMWRHGFELWEELVRVPLIVHLPGAKAAHVAARRSAIDLVPTLLELLHVPAPGRDAKGNDFLSGVSMVPDLFLDPGEKAEDRDVFMDMPDGPYNDPRRALIHGDLKLTVSNNSSYELYDLAKDPEERENLWSKESPEGQLMMQLYAAQKARLREIRVTGEKKTP